MLQLMWGIVAFSHSKEPGDACTFNKRIKKHRSYKMSHCPYQHCKPVADHSFNPNTAIPIKNL